MKIMLTGATGFIGSHLLEKCLQMGDYVTCLCRNKNPILLQNTGNLKIITKKYDDLTDKDFDGIDVCVHLASTGVSPQKAHWKEIFQYNIFETYSLFERAIEFGVNRFVVAGTAKEYGRSSERYDFIPATAPLEPIDNYGASKAAAFETLYGICSAKTIGLYYGRIFNVYGEGQQICNFWPSLVSKALSGSDFHMTDGKQIRDFISIGNVVESMYAACSTPLTPGQPKIVNIGTGEPVSLREFAEREWLKFGGKGKIILGSIPKRVNEISRCVAQL